MRKKVTEKQIAKTTAKRRAREAWNARIDSNATAFHTGPLKLRVRVNKKHIKNGEPEFTLCPIALAINDIVGAAFPVIVTPRNVLIDHKLFGMPLEARNFIEEFDYGDRKKCVPFEFDLEETLPSRRLRERVAWEKKRK